VTPVLLVTGPVGVGKTAVLLAAGDLLTEAGVPHAAVVLEEIQRSWPAPPDDQWNERLGHRNLASLWSNFAAAGAERLLLERVLEQRSQLRHLREAIPGAEVTVVWLRAPLALIERRVRGREPRRASEWHLGAPPAGWRPAWMSGRSRTTWWRTPTAHRGRWQGRCCGARAGREKVTARPEVTARSVRGGG
jgi:hypothetical protein